MNKSLTPPNQNGSSKDFTEIPGETLVTYNLINSALACVHPEFRRHASLLEIEDFCTLVDLFCLYDKVCVIGKRWDADEQEIVKKSHLAWALAESKFIKSIHTSSLGDLTNLENTYQGHFKAFLGKDLDGFPYKIPSALSSLGEDYVEVNYHPGSHYGSHSKLESRLIEKTWGDYTIIGGRPDGWFTREAWSRAIPDRTDIYSVLLDESSQDQRMHKFIRRTIVYLACADIFNIPFTPDTARHPLIEGIAIGEKQFRDKLLNVLNLVVAKTTPGDKVLLKHVPPLASLVFQRAITADEIVPEMVRLRTELSPLREKIGKIEKKMLSTPRDEALDAAEEWNKAIIEVERNFGLEPRIITRKEILAIDGPLGDIASNPRNYESLMKAFLKIPKNIVERMLARHTLVELHKIRPELPGAGQIRNSIQRLFYS